MGACCISRHDRRFHFGHSPTSCTRAKQCFAIPRSDNALAESVNGLYKAEVIDYLEQEWDGVNDVALATLDWVHWYNHE
ncbi:integrase core domain-containing protein, partial [Mycobacterium tuberculosis]|nr:integrase core domain-containing protein [Mycobacterium tuberculosis]